MLDRFLATRLTEAERALQLEVRAFCGEELDPGSYEPGFGMAAGRSVELSRKLAARGWLGMALPVEYGGRSRGAVERLLVVEELLRRGAPLEHHWTADRQSGPVINRFGTEEQKRRFLPPICRGELSFVIGMSEPDAGSDLAGVACRAVPVDGGWKLSGTKIWTSNAHHSDWAIVLCRTGGGERHDGLSQLLVDMSSPGITVSPIPFLDGSTHFNEVSFEEVFVPGDLLLGTEGGGWNQVNSELSFERAGPERWISPFILVEQLVRDHGSDLGDDGVIFLGQSIARWWGIRQVSLAVARMIDDGAAPSIESAIGKDLGTEFEQEVMARLQLLVEQEPALEADGLFDRMLARAILISPSWSIRGGTNEILRTVIAKGFQREARPERPPAPDDETATDPLLIETAERAFAATATFSAVQAAERDGWPTAIWDTAAGIGLPWIGVPEAAGGSGGSLRDAVGILVVAGRHAVPLPLAESGLIGGWMLATAGLPVESGPLTVVPGHPQDDLRLHGGRLSGTAHRVPWARHVGAIVALVDGHVVSLAPDQALLRGGSNLAGEGRDTVVFDGAQPRLIAPAPAEVTEDELRLRGALSRAALIAGALRAMADLTISYTAERHQFGRPVGRFQAVQALLVRTAEEAALVDLAVQVAAREAVGGGGRFEIVSAKALANEAARRASRAAHQAHGAIGMTQEYRLHHLSRRLWSWRAEYGDRYWAVRLGQAVAAHGADRLYQVVADGSQSGIAV